MATFNYGKIAATAKRLIERFGGPISIVATNPGTDPVQTWKPTFNSPVTDNAKGVFTSYEQKFIDGTIIRQGDQKVLFSPIGLTVAPDLVGYIQRGAEKWNVVVIEIINPGDTVLIYKAQVRR